MAGPGAKFIRFSTDDLPERDRLDILKEVYGRTILKHDFEPIGDKPFRFEANLLSMPDLGLASGFISRVHAPRGKEYIDGDDCILSVSLSGGRIVRQLGREAVVGEGKAIFMVCGEPGEVTLTSDSRFLSVRVPHT